MPDQDKRWVKSSKIDEDEELLMNSLKSISIMNKDQWIKLARHYKEKKRFMEAECAFLGARYCSFDDNNLMREWLGVYTVNRADSMSKSDILDNANLVQDCLSEIRKDPVRLADELQHVLFILDKPEQRAKL